MAGADALQLWELSGGGVPQLWASMDAMPRLALVGVWETVAEATAGGGVSIELLAFGAAAEQGTEFQTVKLKLVPARTKGFGAADGPEEGLPYEFVMQPDSFKMLHRFDRAAAARSKIPPPPDLPAVERVAADNGHTFIVHWPAAADCTTLVFAKQPSAPNAATTSHIACPPRKPVVVPGGFGWFSPGWRFLPTSVAGPLTLC